jgi:hypothetical protein
VAPGFSGASATANVGGLNQGHGYLVSGGVLLPQEVGIGKFQPVVRYQEFDATITHVETRQLDSSINYIIKGHKARVSLDYAHIETTGLRDSNQVTAGVQLQF